MITLKHNNKLTKAMAFVAVMFVILAIAIVMNKLNFIKADADEGGTEYVKYTYGTAVTSTYTLSEIPVRNYDTSLSAYAMRNYVENRPLATDYDGVVEVNGVGTGFIIGDNLVMTAAHCVYSKEGYFSENCIIKIPNSNPYTSTAKTASAISVHVPKIYVDKVSDNIDDVYQGTQDQDYAILVIDLNDLTENVVIDGEEQEIQHTLTEYGCFLLGMTTDDFVSRQLPIHCMGYYSNTVRISHINYDAQEPIKMGSLSYDFVLDAYNKTSGGPIYTESVFGVAGASGQFEFNTYRTAISIVSGTQPNDQNQTVTSGARIRPEIMQFAYGNDRL